jgi:hypothetical protein
MTNETLDTDAIGLSEPSQHAMPLIFISHDSRDADVAEAFEELISGASGGTLRVFRSSDRRGPSGIEYGAEWFNTIMERLNEASCVVALLTRNSLNRPWILYEAGVARGRHDARVFGVAIGIPIGEASTGPFLQFHNSSDDEDSLARVLVQLIKQAHPSANPPDASVRLNVRQFRERIRDAIGREPDESEQGGVDLATLGKLVEEVKLAVEALSETGQKGRSPSRRFNRFILDELLDRRGIGSRADGWLLFLSFTRDDFPWLYEPGMEFYRALKSRSPMAQRRAFNSLMGLLAQVSESHLLEMISDPREFEESYFLLRRLPDYLRRAFPLPEHSAASDASLEERGPGTT